MAAPRTRARPTRPQPPTVRLRQLPQDFLQFPPGGHALPHGLGQSLRNVIAAGGSFGSAEAHVEMGAMLVPLVAAATGAPARAIGFGERAEEGAPGKGKEAAKEGGSAGPCLPNRFQRL